MDLFVVNNKQTCVKYNFDGCIVTVKKADELYTVKVDPGEYKFRIEYDSFQLSAYPERGDWFVGSVSWFTDKTLFDIEKVNKILNSIKETVDEINKKKVKFMTESEMLELMKTKSAGEVALIKWERILEYAKRNNCKSTLDIPTSVGANCALCKKHRKYGSCGECKLYALEKVSCLSSASTYNKIVTYNRGYHYEFTALIEMLVFNLKEVIKLENKPKLTITLTPTDNDKVILDIENFKYVSSDIYPNLDYSKGVYEMIYITDKNNKHSIPSGCNIVMGDWIEIGEKAPMSLAAAEEIIECIKMAANKLHNVNHGICNSDGVKCKSGGPEIIHDVYGIKITVRNVSETKESISIDANGYDLSDMKLTPSREGCYFWQSMDYPKWDWYASSHDLVCGDFGRFKNGYTDKIEVIQKIVECVTSVVKYNVEKGNFKKVLKEKKVIVV